MSSSSQHCAVLLHDWTRRLVTAQDVGVHYEGAAGPLTAGTVPAAPDERWHAIGLTHPDDDRTPWHATLWLLDPSGDRWETTSDVLARQAAVGFARVLRREDLTRHERAQQALVEAGKALSSERSLDGVLGRIVEQAMALTGARYGALGVLDEAGDGLAEFITVGIDEQTQQLIGDLPRGRGILGVLIDEPHPLRLRRLQDHPSSVGFPPHHPRMESFLGVPIVTTRAVAGRIYLTEKQGAPEFTEEDEALVATLASQAAIAIDNATLNEQLQRTAAQLEEASRHKSTFLANMSHELRSPLNTIIGYTRLLLEEPRGLDAEQVEDLEIVRGSSEHLLALITDLLDLQRIEAGRVSLVIETEDLSSIVDAVAASIRPLLASGVELVVDTSDLQDPLVRCDRTRIRQVLLNVLGNAVKFTQSGTITLTARDEPTRIHLEVRDTGPGIPEADVERIFDSFFQSQAALDRTPGPREGAGLGLAITRMLTELHGGTVRLHSTLGEGTTVELDLPRDPGGAP
jgi:signal transduction histidine kinase